MFTISKVSSSPDDEILLCLVAGLVDTTWLLTSTGAEDKDNDGLPFSIVVFFFHLTVQACLLWPLYSLSSVSTVPLHR